MSISASRFWALTSPQTQFVFTDPYPQFVLTGPDPKLHLPYRGIFIRKRFFFCNFTILLSNSFLIIMVDANETKIKVK